MRRLTNIKIKQGDTMTEKITIFNANSNTQITDFSNSEISFGIYSADKNKELQGTSKIVNNVLYISLTSEQTKTLSIGTHYWLLTVKIGDVVKHYCNQFIVDWSDEGNATRR